MPRKVRISSKCARKVRIWGLRADFGGGNFAMAVSIGGEEISMAVSTAFRRHIDGISPPARIDFSGGMRVGAHLCVLVRSTNARQEMHKCAFPIGK